MGSIGRVPISVWESGNEGKLNGELPQGRPFQSREAQGQMGVGEEASLMMITQREGILGLGRGWTDNVHLRLEPLLVSLDLTSLH